MLDEIQWLRHFNNQPRIGSGTEPLVIQDSRYSKPGFELRISTQDISQATDWAITKPSHVFIVHLSGRMDMLETELDGKGGSSGPATPGELWTVPANCRYASHAKGGIIRFAELSISPQNDVGSSRSGDPQNRILAVSGIRDEFLTTAVTQLTTVALETDDLSQMQADSLTAMITRHLFQAYGTTCSVQSQRTQRDPLLTSNETRLLREFIFDNLANGLSLETLARLVGMTSHQFLIAFRSSFGTTPTQYVITQRLRRVQWYLLHSRLDLTSIALVTGFNSHSHLTTAFTKRFGYPPFQFRRTHSDQSQTQSLRPLSFGTTIQTR